jgi:hypothetical protein
MTYSTTRDEIGQRMDELARRYAKTHDHQIKAELERLSHRIAELQRARC